MQRLLRLGLTCSLLAGCGDDEGTTSATSNASASTDSGSTTDDTLASDITNNDESSSETGMTSVGSSDTGSASTGSDGSSGASGHDSGSSDGSSETAACVPITEDASALGQTCMGDGDCPLGYTCFDGGGVQAELRCQILCVQDCECPDTYACETMMGKGPDWQQCNPG
jgi:hypothetical protein